MFKVIDNYHEKILKECYDSEEKANTKLCELILMDRMLCKSFDYDVQDVPREITDYNEWMQLCCNY